ncbi:MAG: NAD-dependent epimerase/dehydratase family protein, partial [Actinomycetota bacterium]|nr:NAD-dependent epimerase/dehydratase family protein [Actinomycetota bacterium]
GCPVIEFRAHRPGSRTVLAVGTDCCSGKMTTMLELEREAGVRGLDGSFVATGQIGMMISGGGVAVDGIIVDFVNSIVEEVVFTAAQEHDLVLVEGQGALNHPCYSVVTLGLLHGSRPDSMILCHELGRTAIELLPDCPLPSLNRAIEINEQAARWMWPERHCKVAGISVITGHLPDSDARVALTQLEEETGLPTTDVLRYGPARLMDAILSEPAAGKDS